jgi:hypothetical protein
VIVVVPVVVVVRVVFPGWSLTGGSASIQQPGWPLLPQQAWRLRGANSSANAVDAPVRPPDWPGSYAGANQHHSKLTAADLYEVMQSGLGR